MQTQYVTNHSLLVTPDSLSQAAEYQSASIWPRSHTHTWL